MNRELLDQVRSVWPTIVLTVVLGLAAAAATIVQAILLSRIIGRTFSGKLGLDGVADEMSLLLAVMAARAVLLAAREIMSRQAAVGAKAELRRRLIRHISALGPAYARGERTGELLTTLTDGIERLDAYISGYIPQLILTVCVPVVIALALVPVDWVSSLLLLGTAPIIPILMILIGWHTESRVQRQWLSLARMGAEFLDAVQGLPTIILFGRARAERARLAATSERFRETTIQVLRGGSLSGAVLELMCSLGIGLIAVALAIRLIDGGVTFDRALVVFFLTPEFYRPLRELGVQYHAGKEGAAAAQRITEILRTPPAVRVDVGVSLSEPARVPSLAGTPFHLTLTGVTYAYPGTDRLAVKDINLSLPPNTCTALLGRSGAGKSTLVNLLLRFIDPAAGDITVHGIRLTDLPPLVWRQHVALVPQRPHLFAGSLLHNILLGRPDASLAEVRQAVDLAGAASVVERLPHGFDTPLGERGARLSAGEAQRVAIARALLKDAPLLILDEPTSSLDPESELLVRDALTYLLRDRTVLIVAHRLNTVARADRIAVLQDGLLVEAGEREIVAAQNGAYAALLRAAHTAGPIGKRQRTVPARAGEVESVG